MSGVSGSFSAELDAVYRLYCREYELQLQLQQQQIELQKQQLQLQQQLQQVENLQQQQQQQQQTQQQQQQQQQPKLLTSMEMETKVTDVEVLMHCLSVKEKRDFYFLVIWSGYHLINFTLILDPELWKKANQGEENYHKQPIRAEIKNKRTI